MPDFPLPVHARYADRDEPQLADDPWWSYYTSQTRALEVIVTALYESVRAEAR